jgi:hypothetical protein
VVFGCLSQFNLNGASIDAARPVENLASAPATPALLVGGYLKHEWMVY